MAAFNKFNIFVEDLANKTHKLMTTSDAFKVYLVPQANQPLATNTVKANISGATLQNGYTTEPSVTPTGTRSGGTVTMQGVSHTITASGGTVGPFRFVVLYNDTPTSPADPLVGWWDRGADLTLQNGESFSIRYNDAAVGVAGDILTLA